MIVIRVPNFGWNIVLNLKIDGRTVANIVPAGHHVLTVSAAPN